MNINEIIPKTQIVPDLGTKIWTTRSINKVLKDLDKVTDFLQNSCEEKQQFLSYAIPTWFYFLNNEKLTDKLLSNKFFIDYLKKSSIQLHKDLPKLTRKSFNETVLTDI